MSKKAVLGIFLAVSFLFLGCSKKDLTTASDEQTTDAIILKGINIEDTQPATEYVDSTIANHENQALITTGILTNLPEEADDHGNVQAHFRCINGSEFIAVIDSNTILPEDLIVNETYDIYHSSIQTLSVPGKFPEVYKILLAQ